MIKVFNKLIPVEGCLALTAWPFCFIRKDARKFDEYDENHEKIHCYQQIEMLLVMLAGVTFAIPYLGVSWWWLLLAPTMYFIWYMVEYFIRSIIYGDKNEGYRNIATEQEAYMNEKNLNYLNERKPFAWLKYLGRKTYRKKDSYGSSYHGDDF